jgi:hypothetical protein
VLRRVGLLAAERLDEPRVVVHSLSVHGHQTPTS